MITRHANWCRASLILLTLGCINPGFAAETNRYELHVGDEVRVTVYKEPDMSGTFKIGTTGTVSIPGIGELKGEGLTSGELRDAAVQALVARHFANPSVTVDVSQFAPVFVMGDVRNPGRHAYAPGLTVLQLVAVAGGYPLPPGLADSSYVTRDQDRNREELASARERYASQAVRRARLQAERDGLDTFAVPAGLEGMVGKERLDQIKASELHLMRTKLDEIIQRTSLLQNQSAEIEKGRLALEEQIAATRRLKTIVDAELRNVRDLKERGLTANTRVLELERISADTEMRLNNGLAMVSQANQGRVSIELQIAQAAESAKIKLAEQMIETETELAISGRRIAAAVEFLNASGAALPNDLSVQTEILRRFSIVRSGSETATLVSESTPVRPGDVLTVTRGGAAPLIGMSGSTAGSTSDLKMPQPRQPIAN